MFMPLVMLGGAAEAYNEEVAMKKEQVAAIQAAKREWLFKTGMENIQTRREARKAAVARVSEAKGFGFTSKAAMALEMSGQLEFEMDKIKKLIGNNKLSETYVPTLVAYLEDKVDNDEDLAKALSKGLAGDSLVTEEEQTLGLINALDDVNELQEQFLKTSSGKSTSIPAFQYTPTKGARIELSDMKSIRAQLANTLNTIYADSFQVNQMGEVTFTQNADPDVQRLFNDLADKTKRLAEDPTNTFSPTTALNTVIGSIQNSQNVKPNVVVEQLDNAISTPDFNWEPFRATPPRTPPGNGNNNNNPTMD